MTCKSLKLKPVGCMLIAEIRVNYGDTLNNKSLELTLNIRMMSDK